MDALNSYFVIIGIIAIGVGIYVLVTKKLVGRNVGSAKREVVLKFVPIDASTYIIEGVLMVLMGLPKYFPFVNSGVGLIICIGFALAIIVVNVVLANKFFPDAKSAAAAQNRRLR